MNISGLVRSSLIDFPGIISAVVFTAGCNFRCPWCHNAELALKPVLAPPTHALDTVLSFLESRRGLLGGVVITGGEPTLQPGLREFCLTVHAMGFAVKLDSNGTRPEILENLLASGLLDYVAMDVKGPPDAYAALTGISDVPLQAIERSMEIIACLCRSPGGSPSAEFRTTVMEPQFDDASLLTMAHWIPAGIPWKIQGFTPQHGMLDPVFSGRAPSSERLVAMQSLVDNARNKL